MKKITKLDRPQTSIDRFFGDLLSHDFFSDSWKTDLLGDIASIDDKYVIKIEVPGYSEEDIKIDLKNGLLSISGQVKIEEDGFYSDKSFSRQWSLPDNIIVDKIEATIKNGILTVKVPKTEEEQLPERTIPVKQLDK